MDTTETRLNVKKSILVLNLAKYFGGASVRTVQMARMLQADGYSFCVVVLDQSPLHLQLESEGLPVRVTKYGRGDIRMAFWLKNLVNEENYQVIDTHNPQSHLWGLLASKLSGNCHVVTTVHGCYGEAEVGWRSKLYNAVLQWNDNKQANFIAVSGSVLRYLGEIGIKDATITYSENAVLPPQYTDNDPTVRELADWGNETVIIAIAARLETVKGIKYLIEAFAAVQKTNPQARLCIMGDGRLKDSLKQMTLDLDIESDVFFTGFRKDVPILLSSVDIFCLASLSEGLPFAVLEAAMAKLPLVLSEVGGLAEFFTHEQTALLFPVKDVEQLTSHFNDLINDKNKREMLGTQTHAWVSERFSAQKMFNQTVTLYNR